MGTEMCYEMVRHDMEKLNLLFKELADWEDVLKDAIIPEEPHP